MNYSRWSRVAEWSVVVAVLSFHAWLLFIPGPTGTPPSLLASLFGDSLPLCYFALIGSWLILGPGNAWLRGALAGGIAACWLIFFTDRFPNTANELPELSEAAFISFVIVALSLIVLLRLCGLRMVPTALDRPVAHPMQFSIRSMIVATTVIAALIGGLEYLRPLLAEPVIDTNDHNYWNLVLSPPRTHIVVRSVVIAIALATVACGTLLVVLRPGAIWLRASMLVAVIPCLAAYLVHLGGSPSDAALVRAAELATAFIALSGLIAVTVLPLRLFGYRLMRPSAVRKVAAAAIQERSKCSTAKAPAAPLKEALS